MIGRFAPSPSGPLHRGSVVAALGSWLDARSHGGPWLLRIEDIDPPRERVGAADIIQRQLRALGLDWDGPVLFQSQRDPAYAAALDRLAAADLLYGCRCTRRDAAQWPRSPASGEANYPGTCRGLGLLDPGGWRAAGERHLAIRWRLPDETVDFVDRSLGPQRQRPVSDGGDPILRRADGLWAYQLAVVVDDGDSAISDVVRGSDLLPSTGRQILLQRALGLPQPRYLHLPLVVDANGHKLSKHEGAAAVGLEAPIAALAQAAACLDLEVGGMISGTTREAWLADALQQWLRRYPA